MDEEFDIVLERTYPKHVKCVCISPDGNRYAIATGATVEVFDRTQYKPVWTTEFAVTVNSIAFSNNNKTLAVAINNGRTELRAANTGVCVRMFTGHISIRSVRFSPCDAYVVTGGDDIARVWDAEDDECISTLKGHADSVSCACFSPDGLHVLTGSTDWTARVWNARSGAFVFVAARHTNAVTDACYSGDGRFILTASIDNTARLGLASDGTRMHTYNMADVSNYLGANFVNVACFSPCATYILTGASDGVIRVWDTEHKSLVKVLHGYGRSVTSAVFSPDASRILSGYSDGRCIVWEVAGLPPK